MTESSFRSKTEELVAEIALNIQSSPFDFYIPKAKRLSDRLLHSISAVTELLSESDLLSVNVKPVRQETIAQMLLLDWQGDTLAQTRRPFLAFLGTDVYYEFGLDKLGFISVDYPIDPTPLCFGFGVASDTTLDPAEILSGQIKIVTKYPRLTAIALSCLLPQQENILEIELDTYALYGDSEFLTRELLNRGIRTICADLIETGNSMVKQGLNPNRILYMPAAVLIGSPNCGLSSSKTIPISYYPKSHESLKPK